MTPDYAARQIGGVWKMAWNLPGWEGALDRSVDGVFRSFWAALIAAPFVVLGFVSVRRAAARAPDFPDAPILAAPVFVATAIEVAAFAVDWGASLAALIVAARLLKAERHAADAIIGYNWLQVPTTAAQALPLAASSLGREIAGLLFLPVLAFVVALYWGMLRRSLRIGPAAAAGLILLLTIVGLVANALVSTAGLALLQ